VHWTYRSTLSESADRRVNGGAPRPLPFCSACAGKPRATPAKTATQKYRTISVNQPRCPAMHSNITFRWPNGSISISPAGTKGCARFRTVRILAHRGASQLACPATFFHGQGKTCSCKEIIGDMKPRSNTRRIGTVSPAQSTNSLSPATCVCRIVGERRRRHAP
jgi:hypothetical protein